MKLPIPNDRSRPAYRLNRSTTAASQPGLQGSNAEGSTGGTVANGTTYREVVSCTGAARLRVRILTAGGGAGTLNVKLVAPIAALSTDESVQDKNGWIDPTKVTSYTTGSGTVAVVSATESKVDLDMYGESYAVVEFVCSGSGTLTFCDVSQV